MGYLNPQRAKRSLFTVHRWLGVALCLFVVLWFVSGITMMYVGYPSLDPATRLAHLSQLDRSECCVPLRTAWQALPPGEIPISVMLVNSGSRHVYQFATSRGPLAVDALSGKPLSKATAAEAVRSATHFFSGSAAEYHGLISKDIWSGRSHLDAHRPLHRVQIHDEASSLAYVSSVTGEVVLVATQAQQRWNYVGAWLHWLYFIYTGGGDTTWRVAILALSAGAFALALTGTIVGIMRWRFRGRHANGSRSPYRDLFYRWHHVAGMFFAVVTLTALFSGFMSMNPAGVFTSKAPPLDVIAYAGGALAPERFAIEAKDVLADIPAAFSPRQIEWRMVDGSPYLVIRDQNGSTLLRDAAEPMATQFIERLPDQMLMSAGARLVPGAKVKAAQLIEAYDVHYYRALRHTLYGGSERPLPVIKLVFDDADETWVYLDPGTGAVVARLDDRLRLQRWLFSVLHTWDFPSLLSARPLWDLLLIIASLGGIALAGSGAVMGYRRLRWHVTRNR